MKAFIVVSMIAILGFENPAWAEQDCNLGQRYLYLARERIAASEIDDAVKLLQEAIVACPSYDAYQLLAEIESKSPERAEQGRAVDAFVSAHELAPSDR